MFACVYAATHPTEAHVSVFFVCLSARARPRRVTATLAHARSRRDVTGVTTARCSPTIFARARLPHDSRRFGSHAKQNSFRLLRLCVSLSLSKKSIIRISYDNKNKIRNIVPGS